jgi:proteasome beta subunit
MARNPPADHARPLHETDPSLVSVDGESDDATVAETGTTIAGVTTDDAVVLAADRRASVGGGRFVTNKNTRKVESVHPSAAAALSGTVGHLQRFVRLLRAESSLYEDRRGEPIPVEALGTLAGNVLRTSHLAIQPLVGGVDDDGPHLFEMDGGGGVLEDRYAAGGSGMQLAYGVLERRYADGLAIEDARRLAADAIDAASERDTASGNGLTVATVTADGVEVAEYDAAAEVAS